MATGVDWKPAAILVQYLGVFVLVQSKLLRVDLAMLPSLPVLSVACARLARRLRLATTPAPNPMKTGEPCWQ